MLHVHLVVGRLQFIGNFLGCEAVGECPSRPDLIRSNKVSKSSPDFMVVTGVYLSAINHCLQLMASLYFLQKYFKDSQHGGARTSFHSGGLPIIIIIMLENNLCCDFDGSRRD